MNVVQKSTEKERGKGQNGGKGGADGVWWVQNFGRWRRRVCVVTVENVGVPSAPKKPMKFASDRFHPPTQPSARLPHTIHPVPHPAPLWPGLA